jgi:hypothetical protein
MTMRKTTTLLVLAALLGTACKSTSDSSSASSTSPTQSTVPISATSEPSTTEPSTESTTDSTTESSAGSTSVESTGPVDTAADTTDSVAPTTDAPPTTTEGVAGPGVTDDSIAIGVLYPDLDAVRQFVDLDHGSYEDAYNAVINDINTRGGINGRTIIPEFIAVSPLGTDPAAAACTKLTEDDKVFAVVGTQLDGDAPLCYVETHNTPLVGGVQTAERLDRANAPWFGWELSSDRLTEKLIGAWNTEGVFDGKKVALVSLAADQATLNDVAVPALKELGIEPVGTAVIDAPIDDVQAAYNQVGVISQKFEADGADVLILVGQVPVTWGQGSLNTTYRPAILGTSNGAMQAWASDQAGPPDPDAIAGALTGDGGSLNVAWADESTTKCVALIEAAGPQQPINDPRTAVTDTKQTWVAPAKACAAMTLFAAIATAAGNTLNVDTFRAAGENLGTLRIPSLGADSTYTPTSTDGDVPVFMSRWDPDQQKFVSDDTPVQ